MYFQQFDQISIFHPSHNSSHTHYHECQTLAHLRFYNSLAFVYIDAGIQNSEQLDGKDQGVFNLSTT